ncbi:nuclear transport factor 2 family protein [Streptomyces phaeolivaceus]|uniref:nuclear transport factor 2 family protein n=1 Tax=Streptomyces phaeolivaceus TaxID=2653200 RepID=UPI001D050E11|nr:nuclear transport factor 2 family protein [Streptomyces phaeolivaceus]
MALKVAEELFHDLDPTAVDRWMVPDYRQHNPTIADGRDGLRAAITTLAALAGGTRFEPLRVIGDGDQVAVVGVYHHLNSPEPLFAFDLYRFDQGRPAEHWDALAPLGTRSASALSGGGLAGPADGTADTEANRALVVEFAQRVLSEADYSLLSHYVSGETARSSLAPGTRAVSTPVWWPPHQQAAGPGHDPVYKVVHKVVAEGDLVLAQSEGELGVPVAIWDLFRVADGAIVEHWDIINPVPTDAAHTNGLF